jgi:Patatin phospholipase
MDGRQKTPARHPVIPSQLWNARGEFPPNTLQVMTREKEIRYSSRTRAGTDQFKHVQKVRYALAGLLEKLPEHRKNSPEARLLGTVADRCDFVFYLGAFGCCFLTP